MTSSTKTGVVGNDRDACVLNSVASIIFLLGFIGGGTALGIGVWTVVDRNYTSAVLGTDLMTASAWMLAIAGGMAVLLSIWALVAVCIRRVWAMYTYCILQGLVFVMLIASFTLALVFKAHIGGSPEDIHQFMRETIYDDYGVKLENAYNREVTEAWDTTQGEDSDWAVYEDSEWYKLQPIIEETGVKPYVPESCCNKMDGEYIDVLHCQCNENGPPGDPSSPIQNDALHYRGCFRASKEFSDRQADFLVGTSISVAIVTILPGLIFGVYMGARGIPAEQEHRRRESLRMDSIMYPSRGSMSGMHGYR